jgi:hypothetical protein
MNRPRVGIIEDVTEPGQSIDPDLPRDAVEGFRKAA